MAKIDGWSMLVWKGTSRQRGAMIGGTTRHSLQIQREMVEVSGVAQEAREFVPGKLTWQIEVEHLVMADDATHEGVMDEIGMLQAGTKVAVTMQVGLDYYEGTAMVTNVDVSGPLRGKATARCTMAGAGMLTIVDVANDGFDYVFPVAFDAGLGEDSETE